MARILGIETSCDETAAAVVTDAGDVLSDVVHSQIKLHEPYGGVVPELASRAHLRNLAPVLRRALDDAGVDLGGIDGVAVTCRPGLAGALLVGVQTAIGLAWARRLPLVGVDHLVGHLLAAFLRRSDEPNAELPTFPFIALVASGGHTALYCVDGPALASIRELGATRDDAAGEAFDKVAKLLGLGYPGGPLIDRLAREGDPTALPLGMPLARRDSLEFSFSGLKTSVARWVALHGVPGDTPALRDLCASFQRCVTDTLLRKALSATEQTGVRQLVLAGGVAANRELRERALRAGEQHGVRVVLPSLRSCTDNAAMIAYAGAVRLSAGERDGLDLATNTKTALLRVSRKGAGKR